MEDTQINTSNAENNEQTPIRTVLEKAMDRETPVRYQDNSEGDTQINTNNAENNEQTPIRTVLEKAMDRETPVRYRDNSAEGRENPGTYPSAKPGVDAWESKGDSQTEVDLGKQKETLTPPTNTIEEIKATNNAPENIEDRLNRLSKQLPEEDQVVIKAIGTLIKTPEIKTSLDKILIAEQNGEKENNNEEKEKKYTDKDGNLVNIPLPIQEEMDLTFNKNSNVKNPGTAASYGFMENNLYNERLNAKIQELKSNGWSDKEINSYMNIAKHEIKESIQQYVKGTVTRDIRLKVIDRITQNPEKYKDYIDPSTGKVIDSIVNENIIGEILGQKIYPEWEMGEENAIREPEIINKQRDFKTAALIAGVVVGGAAGILGGATVGVPVAAAAGVVSIGGRITNHFLGKSLTKIGTQLKDPTLDGATRERLEKRESNLKKIQNVVQHITKFATGAALGAGISSFISNVAMGGHGLVWNKPEIPTGIPGGAEGSLGNTGIEQTQPTSTGETPIPTTESVPETYDLFANGQVNLDGSAMDGWRLADVPEYYQNMPLEQIPAEQFANSGSKAFQIFIRDLQGNGITNEMLSQIPKPVLHRALAEGAYNQTSILEFLRGLGYLK